jgi:hypothetical protein
MKHQLADEPVAPLCHDLLERDLALSYYLKLVAFRLFKHRAQIFWWADEQSADACNLQLHALHVDGRDHLCWRKWVSVVGLAKKTQRPDVCADDRVSRWRPM